MKRVDVMDETIEFFLSNCSSLEKLVVDDTYKLLNVHVSGPSLVLKHLELVRCHHLMSVKVCSAPKLTSLFLQRVEELLLENVPVLVELSGEFCGYGDTAKNLILQLSCCISRLEVLVLKLTKKLQGIVLSTFFELPKLKKLVIVYSMNVEKSLMGLTSLIRTSPYLEEFVLKIMDRPRGFYNEVKNIVMLPHHHLKVVKFCGNIGYPEDLELLGYILESCLVLDKIIIDSYPKVLDHQKGQKDYRQYTRDYMKQQLEARVPQHIELVIL